LARRGPHVARASGLHAERVETSDQLGGAAPRAFAALPAARPALLNVPVTIEALSSDSLSGLAWVPALQPLVAWDDAQRRWRAGD